MDVGVHQRRRPAPHTRPRAAARARQVLGRPKGAGWPIHSCGNTPIKCRSWPNFWASLASFSLQPPAPRPQPRAPACSTVPRRGPIIPRAPWACSGRSAGTLRVGSYDAFGVFGTVLQENVGVFHSKALRRWSRKFQAHRMQRGGGAPERSEDFLVVDARVSIEPRQQALRSATVGSDSGQRR